MNTLIAEYISEQVENLANKSTCCIHWSEPFSSLEPDIVRKIARYDLKTKAHVINGHNVTKVYKSSCNHSIIHPGSFQLTNHSQKDILYYLKKCDTDPLQKNVLISPQIFRSARQKPVLPPNRFTIGPLRESIYQSNAVKQQLLQKSWRIYPFRAKILQKISDNRILVINGDVSLEKSTSVPLFIVEDSTATGAYCKILCVEADNLLAITHCTVLTKYIEERIGSRVGFQVYLQSRVCDNTNLIYTTAVFFLRVLMGQDPKDSFRHISHIVVSDVHLHHAYTDILLHEIRNILPHYPQIKIILLSNSTENAKLLSYFGEGEELHLDLKLFNLKLYYLEEIKLFLESSKQDQQTVCDIIPNVIFNSNLNKELIDKALEEYEGTGSDDALNRFLYLVHEKNVSINCSHSKLGYTAFIAAAKRGNHHHINRLLTYENANPFLQDKSKLNALEYALSHNNVHCASILLNFRKANVYECKPPPIDFDIIKQLVQLITTSWKFGHILVFLPTYEDLLKLSYGILRMQFIGKIPQEVSVCLLHPNTQYDQLQPIIADSIFVKIILATSLAESLTYLNDITYVIDSGLNCVEKYHPESKCKISANEWISKESLERRSTIASRFTAGHCFRLFPQNLCRKLVPLSMPELLYMSMNRISLIAKLLCPNKMVVEYLQKTIVRPPLLNVLHSIEFLKQIEVFDCMEEVTWLGCRLIDVQVELELGKALVLAILLKCLDPVLTVVSFLTCTSPSEIARCKGCIVLPNKKEKVHLNSEGSYSDHLTLLRRYQVWQNDKRENTVNDILSDEETYVINGILDKVCGIRTHLVGALRSSQLIHNQGPLSMHSINSKANNWAVIKAALSGGLYPKLCIIDRNDYRLKSRSRELCIHSTSTLRNGKNGTLISRFPSNWIIYFRETNSLLVNSISNCTLVSPITIALLAGKTELNPENIQFPITIDQKLLESRVCCAFYIDEWIWLTTDLNSALLLYKLRQKFNAAYLDFLQTCGSTDKWRKLNAATTNENPLVFDVISRILLEEDIRSGFAQPNHVGNRPKAVANKFTSDFDIGVLPRQIKPDGRLRLIQYRCLDKEFFLISLFDSHEIMKSFWKLPVFDISRESLFNTICSGASQQKLTYVVVYSMNRKRFTNVAHVKWIEGGFFLWNCFQANILVYDVIIMCATYKITLPSFRTAWNPVKLDNRVGEIILNLL